MNATAANDLRAAATVLLDNASDIGFVSGVLEGVELAVNLMPCQREGIVKARASIQRVGDRNQQAIETLAATAATVTEMAICEVPHVMLHVNQLYRFVVMPGCEKCAVAAKATPVKER